MDWKTFAVATTADLLDELEALFWEAGAVSVSVEDAEDNPIFEPGPGEIPVWLNAVVKGLFTEDVNEDLVRSALLQAKFELKFVETMGDRVWEREWLIRFKPMRFGERLWVCPTGHEVNEAGAVVMDLDPGLAFGTGTHGTTRMCLAWLDAHNMQDRLVVDYGSGSGILGIAALLLGAERVVAVDNDPQALLSSHNNAARNHVEHKLEAFLPEGFVAEPFDLVIANILAKPLIELADKLCALVKPGGDIVLSGIMVSQANDVIDAYPLKLVSRAEDDGWVCLHMRREGE